MTTKSIINTALKLRKEYGNIYNLIKDKGIIDDSIRQFSKIEAFKGSREETQANLFATIFLQAKYKDCDNNDEIQKIINYVWCNYLNFK